MDNSQTISKRSPLEGIQVVEFTNSWAGPLCGMVLADMGARVIKIENPDRPDISRRTGYFADEKPGINRSGFFAVFNRGKQSCVLNLKKEQDLEVARKLIQRSDIVVENFAPGVMDRIGLSYSALKELRPDIIMVSLSGYGATGPDRSTLAYGQVLEAYAGLNTLIGYPNGDPKGCGIVISDHLSGISGAFAVLAALRYRNLTGIGQHIDVSEVEVLLAAMPEAFMEYQMTGNTPVSYGNRDNLHAPQGCYRCKGDDAWIAISIFTENEWQDFCRIMEIPELVGDYRFKDAFMRLKHQDELDLIIDSITRNLTADSIFHKLSEANITCSPTYTEEEIYNDPHIQAREFFVRIDHPEVGKRFIPGLFAKLSDTPGSIKRHDPLFGEHTQDILEELRNEESRGRI